MSSDPKLYTIVGPSGVGKTSLVQALLKTVPDLHLSISYTTRPQRKNETHGVNYYFVDTATFKRMCDDGEFLEYAKVFGHYYGTARQWVHTALEKKYNVLLEIDWQGAANVRTNMPQSIQVFILPSAISQLEERLAARKQDSAEVIQQRLAQARAEMRHYDQADYLVINDNFETALKHLQAIFNASTDSDALRVASQQSQHASLLKSLIGT